jgi:CRP/FNR family transcriptional regulator, nitrogen fixation regulation protein
MTNIDFGSNPIVLPKPDRIRASVEAPRNLIEAFVDDGIVKGAISMLRRAPIRFYRDNLIVCEGDSADYLFLIVSGNVRACKTFQNGTRNIVAFYLPGDLFGWSDHTHSISIEAVTDTMVVFLKRSALLSIASRDNRIAKLLLRVAAREIQFLQDHALLLSRDAKCRVATFLTDFWVRLGKPKYVDFPMSHQEIADHLGLTIETLSRTITSLEKSGIVSRAPSRRLSLRNPLLLARLTN